MKPSNKILYMLIICKMAFFFKIFRIQIFSHTPIDKTLNFCPIKKFSCWRKTNLAKNLARKDHLAISVKLSIWFLSEVSASIGRMMLGRWGVLTSCTGAQSSSRILHVDSRFLPFYQEEMTKQYVHRYLSF